jgi:uncharacterized protein
LKESKKIDEEKKLLIPKTDDARIIYGRIPLQENYRYKKVNEFKQLFDKEKLNQKFKLSPFVKIFEGKNDEIAIFHNYLSKKIYGKKELRKFLIEIKKSGNGDSKILKELIKNDFVIPDYISDSKYKEYFLKEFRDKIYDIIPDIRVMYIILTDRCNLSCKYCFIEKGALKDKSKYGDMNYETGKEGVDFFIDQIKNGGEKRIIFYGGEPLLNIDVLKKVIVYIRDCEKSEKFNGPVTIQIITNGVLINKEISAFLSENNVIVGVSIDGTKEINDQMRLSETNEGTFDRSINGYKLLKEAGVDVGISCTIGNHNVDHLDKIVEYFFKELDVSSIGFNLPNLVKGQEDLIIPIEKITENMIKAYAVCRKYGISEDRLGQRRVSTFVEDAFWTNDCSGCGDQIVILPNGSIGPCHAFLGSAKYFDANIHKKEDLRKNSTWIEWKKRSPLFMEQCQDCSAISICGGGCPYMAHENHGSIWNLDERTCIFCNRILEWLIGELYKKSDKNNR